MKWEIKRSRSPDRARSAGRLIQVGYTPGTPLPLNSADVALKELRIQGCRAAAMQDLLDALDAVASGAVRSPVETVIPLESVTEAVQAVASGSTLGRQVLQVGSDAEVGRRAA